MLRRNALLLVLSLLPAIAEARSIYSGICAGKSDDDQTPLFVSDDPRTKATADNGYNAEWTSCHHDEAGIPRLVYGTCGEWVRAVREGRRLLEQEAMIGTIWSAAEYRGLWKAWGDVASAPDRETFEARVIERYGFQPATFANPYPFEGETPSGSFGGNGQLPMGLIQAKDADGYTGEIGITCLLCHSNRIGTEGQGLGSMHGYGNSSLDLGVFNGDLVKSGATPLPFPYPINTTRGTVNADSAFEILIAPRDFDTLDQSPLVKAYPLHPSPGDQDPPNWWNHGSRPRVLMDGGVPADNTRTFMAFLLSNVFANGAWQKSWEHGTPDDPENGYGFEAIQTYLDTIEPPKYPFAIDGECDPSAGDDVCAQKGSEIFHTRPLPDAPYGNKSCSSCHGIHDPEYATDVRPAFVSGQIVDLDVIGTDPRRVQTADDLGRWVYSTTWYSYADNRVDGGNVIEEWLNDYGTPDFNPWNRELGECGWQRDDVGYLAPPLLGIWASAPYFHNGSVPTVRDVLDPTSRPEFWRRQLNTPGVGADKGFDTSIDAIDQEKLGWIVDRLDCDGVPLIQCHPDTPPHDPFGVDSLLLNTPGTLAWPLHQAGGWPTTQAEIEQRKVYNTRLYGKSNAGHYFTSDLGETEIRALIEFLKTL